MKKTIYFKSQKEMLDYYGGNVSYIPSNTLAIVGDEDNFVLFSTSNNQSMNGSMEDQGGYIDNISGYAYVTTNGDHNVASYEMVNVNVPNVIPSGYVYVNGTYNISENGTFDVSSYENAYVDVPQGITPTGYSYITTNGDFDISTYAMVNVNVPQGGGGIDYQLVDLSYTMTVGEKYEFNGLLGINGQITSEFAQTYPVFEPYIGSYICGIVGNDNTTSDYYGKGCIFENEPVSLNQKGVVARGTFIGTYDIGGNTDLVVVDDCIEAKYAGGNGTKNITSNGTQQVVGYQSVSVSVPSSNHDGLTEATAFTVDEAIAFINTLDENVPTSNMYYVKGRISQVIYTFSAQYSTWRGYISDDGVMYNDQTASDNVDHTKELFIYNNGYDVNYQTVNWNVGLNPQVKVGDSVIVYANFQLWTDNKISRKPQTNNGYLANHQRAVNGSPVNAITANGVVDVQDYVSVNVSVPTSLPNTCLVAMGDQGTTQIIEPNNSYASFNIPFVNNVGGSEISFNENYSVFIINNNNIIPFNPTGTSESSDFPEIVRIDKQQGSDIQITYPEGQSFNPSKDVLIASSYPLTGGSSGFPICFTSDAIENLGDGEFEFTFTLNMSNETWSVGILPV